MPEEETDYGAFIDGPWPRTQSEWEDMARLWQITNPSLMGDSGEPERDTSMNDENQDNPRRLDEELYAPRAQPLIDILAPLAPLMEERMGTLTYMGGRTEVVGDDGPPSVGQDDLRPMERGMRALNATARASTLEVRNMVLEDRGARLTAARGGKGRRMRMIFKSSKWAFAFGAGVCITHGILLCMGRGWQIAAMLQIMGFGMYAGWHLKARYDADNFIQNGDEDYGQL